MRNTTSIFKKQLKDTMQNKTVLIQFIMFPLLTLIMSQTITLEGMPKNFFVNLFATMYIGMAPLTSIAAVIAEEKEKNTLRVLMMSNVKPYEYLLGVGSYIWFACMLGAAVICAAGGFAPREGLAFMGIMSVGILASLLVGAAIGTWSKTQMMATSITVPVMMIFAFMPMLSMFNDTIAKIAKFIFSQQVSIMLSQIKALQPETDNICIVVINMVIFTVLFTLSYKKSGLA